MEKCVDITQYMPSKMEDAHGVDPKFWVQIDGEKYLFKYPNNNTSLAEIFIDKLCSRLNIPCVNTQRASFVENGKKFEGVLIKSYRSADVVEVVGCDKIFELTKYKNYNMHPFTAIVDECLEEYVNILNEENPGEYVFDSVINELNQYALIDFFTAQADRNAFNIEFLLYEGDDGKKHFKLAPMFDNGRCFSLAFDSIFNSSFESGDIPILTVGRPDDSTPNKLRMGECCEFVAVAISRDKKLQDLFEKIKNVDIEQFVERFEKEIGAKFQIEQKIAIIDTWKSRVANIEKLLDDFKQKSEDNADLKSLAHVNGRMAQSYYDINYYADKLAGKKVNVLDYINEHERYIQDFEDWTSGKRAQKPNIDDYKLICRRVDLNVESEIRAQMYDETQKRRSKVLKLENPDYVKLEYLQDVFDAKTENMTVGEARKTIGKIREDAKLLRRKVEYWIAFGKDYGAMPKCKHSSYQLDVKKRYMVFEELRTSVHAQEYNDWLREEGLFESAQELRKALFDTRMKAMFAQKFNKN